MFLALAAASLFAVSQPQDAGTILAEMEARRASRMASVEDYLMVRSVGGIKAVTFHEKTEDGLFRTVPFDEIEERNAARVGRERVVMTEDLASSYELLGEALRDGLRGEGFPADGVFDPRNMTRPMATFARAGASLEPFSDGRAEAAEEARGMAEFARRARFVGREEIDGVDAFHLRATDLGDVEVAQPGSGEFRLEAASLWVDPKEYVPLRMTIEGRARSDGDWTPITIEKLSQDYRWVGPMYEPHLEVLRLGGIEEAMAEEMRRMQAEIDQLPPAVRRMVESQMRNAMKQFEGAVFVERILVNHGLPTPEQMAEAMLGGGN